MMKTTMIAAATGLLMSAAGAQAEWAPSGPVNLWIAFGAGGPLDTLARVVAQELRTQNGWDVIAENVPAGGGVALLSRLANTPADGQTFGLVVNMPIIMTMAQRPDSVPFSFDSFDYLGSIVRAELGMFAAADAPYTDVAGMMDHARAHGLVISANPGPSAALSQVLIAQSDGAMSFLSAESGAQVMSYVLGGHAQVGYGGGQHLPYLERGEIRMIASVNQQRLSYAPDVPTLIEQGLDFYIDPFFFFVAPAGLEPEVHAALSAALGTVIQSETVRQTVRTVILSDVENFGAEGTRTRLEQGLAEMGPMFR